MSQSQQLSVAPMMDWTDRHCRYFHRGLTRYAMLYSEMVTADAIIFGDRNRLLGFSEEEHPVALQLGGSDPARLAEVARIAEAFGYDEINLNVGCPSDRVQSGTFGACLMREPRLVGDCTRAMKEAVSVPVTVKCRIGVDDQDPEVALTDLASAVNDAGSDALWVHARKAWLEGLSPKENRDIPPLDYERVYRLKGDFPDWFIGINGGIADLEDARMHLRHVDGAMIGRSAYKHPAILAEFDPVLSPGAKRADLVAAATRMIPYADQHIENGGRLSGITRHMLGLFAGRPGARLWRQILTVESIKPGAGGSIIADALEKVRSAGGLSEQQSGRAA